MLRLNSSTHRHPAPPRAPKRLARLLLLAAPFIYALWAPAALEAQKEAEQSGAPAARPAAGAVRPCPNIALCCHVSVNGGLLGPFIATLGGAGGVTPSFNWKVSAGEVASGQGTREIVIDTKGLKGGTVLATVEVGGYGPRCSATCVAQVPDSRAANGGGDPRHARLATLSVSVKNARDGRPVPHALVDVSGADGSIRQVETDRRGLYAGGGWKPGTYRVEVSAESFERQESNVTLAASSAGAVALTLKPAPTTPPRNSSPTPSPEPTPSPTATPSSGPVTGETAVTRTPTPTRLSKTLLASAKEGSYLPWVLLGSIIAFVVAGYFLALRIVGAAASAVVGPSEAALGAAAGATSQGDEVHCTAYAPPSAQPDNSFLVQVFAHLKEQAAELAELAACPDPTARSYGTKKLAGPVERGRELSFTLQMPGLEIDDPTQSVVWNGDIECVAYGVTVPADFRPKTVVGTVTVAVLNAEGARVPVGTLKFMFKVAAADAPQPVASVAVAPAQTQAATPAAVAAGQSYVPHKRAFISYASQNRPEVQKRVQMLLAEGVECYMDVLTFRPGERWESNIYQYIDRCDIFYLFWSEAAKGSPWVRQEIVYALKKKGESPLAPPEIMPIPIEGPPIVPPPEDLSHLHFNDPILYFIKCEEEARRPPARV